MSGVEQEQLLSMGVLVDIVDEQWMRDTLPADGARSFLSSSSSYSPFRVDVPVPPSMAVKTEEAEDPAPANEESQPAQGDVWRDFALENL
ncbi:hypothetical protein ABZP36_001667 [Zizania latifolia]